jgi:2-C-methyl-D-erythritol 4-phosphate cytidylyltransferase
MARFSVVVVTAIPSAQGVEGSGAFIKVDGRESLLRSVDLFVNREGVCQIQLVIGDDKFDDSRQKFGGHLSFSGAKLTQGGRQWFEQLAAAQEKIAPEATHVVIHDGARPAVAFNDLEALMAEAEKHPIVVMTTPVRSGLIEVDESGKPVSLGSARRFQQVVTPWALRKDKFAELVKNKRDPSAGEMWLLHSSPLNVRVASASDASLAKSMIAMLPKPKVRAADNPFEEAQW